MSLDRGFFPAPPALVEHARRFADSGGVAATPKVAATVLLLRPAGTGFEVYMIRRHSAMVFGGVHAFVGGGVDASDSRTDLRWAGPDAAEWGRRLGLTPEAAQAVVCAAAREVFEEAGVLLAGPTADSVVGDVSSDDWEAVRAALVQRRLHFADLLAERELTLRSDLLLPWSRWITPEFEPRRFDTYFFAALLPAGQRTRDVSGEADHTEWVRPEDVIARLHAAEITMLPPTLITLQQVAAAGDLDGVARAAARRQVATPLRPRLEQPADGPARFVLE